jgi:hypothetical protein
MPGHMNPNDWNCRSTHLSALAGTHTHTLRCSALALFFRNRTHLLDICETAASLEGPAQLVISQPRSNPESVIIKCLSSLCLHLRQSDKLTPFPSESTSWNHWNSATSFSFTEACQLFKYTYALPFFKSWHILQNYPIISMCDNLRPVVADSVHPALSDCDAKSWGKTEPFPKETIKRNWLVVGSLTRTSCDAMAAGNFLVIAAAHLYFLQLKTEWTYMWGVHQLKVMALT